MVRLAGAQMRRICPLRPPQSAVHCPRPRPPPSVVRPPFSPFPPVQILPPFIISLSQVEVSDFCAFCASLRPSLRLTPSVARDPRTSASVTIKTSRGGHLPAVYLRPRNLEFGCASCDQPDRCLQTENLDWNGDAPVPRPARDPELVERVTGAEKRDPGRRFPGLNSIGTLMARAHPASHLKPAG